MNKRLDKFPTYEELKELNKEYEYYYDIANMWGSGYLRFTYNEDYEGKISIDYLEGGFIHNIHLPIYNKTKIIENKLYNLNKKNYNDIVKYIELVYKALNDCISEFQEVIDDKYNKS